MIESSIDNSDIVVMYRPSIFDRPEDGDMVAVWLIDSGETTLKHIFYSGETNQVRLQSVSKNMPPKFEDPENVLIQGRVIKIIRQCVA